MGEGLGASQSSIGRAHGTGSSEDGAITLKHDERGILIC
jgi:hypothetical protein